MQLRTKQINVFSVARTSSALSQVRQRIVAELSQMLARQKVLTQKHTFMSFTKLTSTSGTPVYVNAQHVLAVFEKSNVTQVLTTQVRDGVPYYIPVKETAQDVVAAIQETEPKNKLFGII